MPERRDTPAPLRKIPVLAGAGLVAALMLAAPAASQDGRAASPDAFLAPPPEAVDLPPDGGLRYGAEGEDVAFGLRVGPDGDIAIGGFLSAGPDTSPAWWMRFDSGGLPERASLLPSGDAGAIYWLSPLANGDTLALGDTEVDGGYHAAVWRLSPDGGILWSADAVEVPGQSSAVAAAEVPGGDVVVGLSGSDPDDAPFAIAVRASAGGDELWRRPIPDLDDVAGMMLRADGSLLVAGNKATDSGNEIRLVALAQDGSSKPDTALPTDGRMNLVRAAAMPGGGTVMAVSLSNGDDAPAAVMLAAADGGIRWIRSIATGPGALEDARPVRLADGSTAIATVGSVTGPDGDLDAFAGLLGLDGDWLWARRFRGPQDTHLYAVAQRADGGLVAAGEFFVPPPRAASAGTASGWEEEVDNWDAWIVTLSADGALLPMAGPIDDPAMAALAEELRIAVGQGVPGTPDLADTSTPYVGPLGPPAFRRDGDHLVMATAPFLAGPILLNTSRSRLLPEAGSDAVTAVSTWANPILQVADEDGIATATAGTQRIDWSYRPGLLLVDRHSMSLDGIEVETPDGLRLALDSLTGDSRAEVLPDGRFDSISSYRLGKLSGEQADSEPSEPPFRLSVGGATLQTELRGVDLVAYGDALRSEDPKARARVLDTALRIGGSFGVDGINAEGPDEEAEEAGLLRIALDRFGIDVMMERPAPAAPVDLGIDYALAGLRVDRDGIPAGALGEGRLRLSGSGWNLAGLQAAVDAYDAADADEAPAAARGVLTALDGLGLELSGREIMFDAGEGAGESRVGRIELALSAAGVAANGAELELRLDGDGLHPGAQPGMPVEAELVPQTLAVTLKLGPLPVQDMATALLADQGEMLPMLLAQAQPNLQIPRLLLRSAGGSLHGDGGFAVDPQSATMLAGQVSLLVTRFERLSDLIVKSIPEKGERAMAAGMAAYLAELGLPATDPEGRPALRFVVQTRPDGQVTVNGEPFPPGNAGAPGGTGTDGGGDGN